MTSPTCTDSTMGARAETVGASTDATPATAEAQRSHRPRCLSRSSRASDGVSPFTKASRSLSLGQLVRFTKAALYLVLVIGLAQRARAEDAASLFEQGRALLARGAWQQACPLFERSQQLEPALGTLLNVADCAERQESWARAHRSFSEAARWAQRTGERKRELVARDRAKALDARVVLVFVEVSATSATGTLRRADGAAEPLEFPVLKYEPVAVEPGLYFLRVTSVGFRSFESRVDLLKPGEVRIVAPLQSEPSPPPAVATPGVDEPKPGPMGPGPVVLGTASSAVALAGLVGAIATQNTFDAYRRQQPGGPDALQPTVTRSQFATATTVWPMSVGALALGVVGVTVSVLWGLLAPRLGSSTNAGGRGADRWLTLW